MLLNCPKPEELLEWVSIPSEISFSQRITTKVHTAFCKSCEQKVVRLQGLWAQYLKPEPEITPSLLRVYSKLQNDETLILKGWKLGEAARRKKRAGHWVLREGWLFRGGISAVVMGVAAVVVTTSLRGTKEVYLAESHKSAAVEGPVMQYRVENKDEVRVRYVKPKLLQSIEFQTTRTE